MSILKGIGIGCGILIAAAIAMLVLIVAVGSCLASQSDSHQPPSSSNLSPAPTPELIGISIADLKREYDSNQLAADQKFEGKWLHVSGGKIINITPSSVLLDSPSADGSFSVRASKGILPACGSLWHPHVR